MSMHARIVKGGIVIAVVTLALLGMVMVTPAWHRPSPCERETPAALAERFPELRALRARQRLETERLLNQQRVQDVIINMQMSSRKISPEEALRLSTGQVEALAALRRRQKAEFMTLCRRLQEGGA